MRNALPNQAQRHCYQAGRDARDLGKDKTPPGGLGAQRRAWWLAGYNDRDIELQVKARKLRDAQREQFPGRMLAWKNVETSQAPYDSKRYQRD